MQNERGWMYRKNKPNRKGLTDEYIVGMEQFLEFATSHVEFMDGEKIRCPCRKCHNGKFLQCDKVREHLCRFGFTPNYYNWTCHGEPFIPDEDYYGQNIQASAAVSGDQSAYNQFNPYQSSGGHNLFSDPSFASSSCPPTDEQIFSAYTSPFEGVQEQNVYENLNNQTYQQFQEMLSAADEPVWAGCDTHTQLSLTARLLNVKAEHNVSENCFNDFVQVMGEALPRDHNMPTDYYSMKKLVKDLGLPVERIDACRDGCMIYWGEDQDADVCKFCNQARYKRSNKPQQRRKAYSQLFYLPLTPRLQRLYASEATAEHMTWHANHQTEDDLMCHPSDAEAWKNFDRTYPEFATEIRNIRLGLCADGFAPFGKSGRNYSCWPVILTPYNLPPGMCMKTPYMFLTLVVPGPQNPKKLIDVYMQPLIAELKQLWNDGFPTYDIHTNQTFVMKAALLWTINDFPAYGMLSGWSTAGILGCPICMERSKSFRLKHGRKASYFDCHRQFLPANHKFRRNKDEFTKNRVERTPPPMRLSGQQLWYRVYNFPSVIEDPHGTPYEYGSTHKWTKRSIFWELPYWYSHLLHHNLDVMHIEKNVFDNLINTVMDIPGKTKDNLNARKDMRLICKRPSLDVDENSRGPKPKAIYTLNREQRRIVCEWLKSLKFPDGYVSNIGRCVDLKEYKLIGMKSHDCHIFMERLIPIAFKELLPNFVWAAISELSIFLHDLCSTVLRHSHMETLEKNIPIILCNLERIFPPSFFDSMEHLLVHLPYEAKVGGPVHYRWMYPFERFLYHLKRKVKNKAHVEASIVNAYIVEEVTTFASYYFEPHVKSKRQRPGRNDEGPIDQNLKSFSIFNYLGRPSGQCKERYLTGQELRAAQTYILLNCPEVTPYFEIFQQLYSEMSAQDFDRYCDEEFAPWFKSYVYDNQAHLEHEFLFHLSWGPKALVRTWPAYFINGYIFHTQEYGMGKSTMNSGVCVQSSENDRASASNDFYGLLDEIIEIEYPGPEMKVILFMCRWFDPIRGMKVHPQYKLVEINHKRFYRRYEPFVLAQQAIQVFYASYPSLRRDKIDWWVVCKTKARSKIEERWEDIAYQQEEVRNTFETEEHDISTLRDPSGIVINVDASELNENINEDAESDDDDDDDDDDDNEDDDDDDNDNENEDFDFI
ncbi:uncharacterized protein LOC141833653 [Curcuma longa]|uniref:uncharacterized protein LOC141833653 n=1 Tax=Curcuma longa TaxID=136217 RepID=UPI003D9DCAA0